MRPHSVEVPPPGPRDHASFCERIEDLAVEWVIALSRVEGLDEAILPGQLDDVGGQRASCAGP